MSVAIPPVVTVCGWVIHEKGLRYLATDRGWVELVDDDGEPRRHPDLRHGCAVKLTGSYLRPTSFVVREVVSVGAPATTRPRFVVTPADHVFLASKARGAVEDLLRSEAIPYVPLPTLWSLSREYGEEELAVSHSQLDEQLFLLQSPEFPMYATLAGGVERFYTWGRCYRYESGTPAGRYLMEFDQLDLGCAHMTLDEICLLTEAIVHAAADAIGVTLPVGRIETRSPIQPQVDDNLVALVLPLDASERVRDVIRGRLETVGADVRAMDDHGHLVVHLGQNPEAARRVLDAVERIVDARPHEATVPFWRSPLPLELDPDSLGRSEYTVAAITSARLNGPNGGQMVQEAELYLAGYEVAHAGVFADATEFRRNIREAHVDDGRFDWLLPMLDAAPPRMAKVGIGWERLLGALLGGVETHRFLLFPRSGTGALLPQGNRDLGEN